MSASRIPPLTTLLSVCALALAAGLWAGQGSATAAPPGTESAAGTTLAPDALPPGAVMRLGKSRFWHPGPVTALAVSQDGKTVASVDQENRIRLWETSTGKLLGKFSEGAPAAPGPGGIVLGFGMGGPISTSTLHFSPDGKLLAVLDGSRGIRLLDLGTRKLAIRISVGPEQPLFAFSPDGKTLATASNKKGVRVWSVATGKEVRKIEGHKGGVSALAYSADGRILATGGADHTVRLWDAHTGKEIRRMTGHRHTVYAVAFSKDGKRVASASADTTIRIWDAETGKEVRRWKGSGSLLAFSPDGTALVETDLGQAIVVWDVATGRALGGLSVPPGMMAFEGGLQTFALSADGRLAVRWEPPMTLASGQRSGGRIIVTEVFTGKDLSPPGGRAGGVAALAWSPNGKRLASGGADCRVTLWDTATGKELFRCEGHTGPVTALAFHPGGGMIASACDHNDRTISLWDTRTGKEVRQLVGDLGPEREVSFDGFSWSNPQLLFSPDGKFLVCHRQSGNPWAGGSGSTIQVWEVKSGKLVKELKGQNIVLAFRPDGKALVSLGHAKTPRAPGAPTLPIVVRQWELGTWKETEREVAGLASSPGGVGPGFSPMLSPDGRRMVRLGAPDGGLELWDVAGRSSLPPVGKGLQQPRIGGGFGFGGGFGWGGGIAFMGGLGSADIVCGQQFVSFAPNGRSVATALSPDGSLRVWELAGGGERCKLAGCPDGVTAICFAPDGRRLASGGLDGTILIWDTRQVPGKGPLSDKDLAGLWDDLSAKDAAKAYRAVCRLDSDPARAVAFLGGRLKPVANIDKARIAKLIADLNGDDFATREAAEKELRRLGDQVRPALEASLKSRPPLEVRRRVQAILGRAGPRPWTPERLRQVRAVEMLEQADIPEARRLLEALAGGAPGAQLTALARESLAQLKRHAGGTP